MSKKELAPEVDEALERAEETLKEAREHSHATSPERKPVPGEIIRHGKGWRKIPYTMKDLRERDGEVTFIPEENIPVTVEGQTIYMAADQEITVPKCFYSVYLEHRQRDRAMSRHPRRLDKVGALEPE